MNDTIKILIVDERKDADILLELLCGNGYEAKAAADGLDALGKLESFSADLILTSLNPPNMASDVASGMDGYELLAELRERGSHTPVILLTTSGSAEKAIALVHDSKAFWFLEKPVKASVALPLIERALEQRNSHNVDPQEGELAFGGVLGNLVGRSSAMQQVFTLIRQVASSSAAVLITGESGTGKEMVAREIHRMGTRPDGPFVAINCAALPETLIESELFGHEKGSFTGATDRCQGCFEQSNGGTLLLDEIGEMPLPTQSKLLRVLEDLKVRRLGGTAEISVDARIIAATNRRPEKSIRQGTLREDLFYRLNVIRIDMPALRERREDIVPIAEAMVETFNKRHDTAVTELTPGVMRRLEAHHWPGNVRELRNAIERAVILAHEGPLRTQHLHLDPSPAAPVPIRSSSGVLTIEPGLPLAEVDKAYIQVTLQHLNNNRRETAKVLGISLRTLQTRLGELREMAEAAKPALSSRSA